MQPGDKLVPVGSVATPPDESAEQRRDRLDRAFVHGVAWTATAKWVSQILAWVTTLVVARILTPNDYGLVALGTVYMGAVTLLTEFGIGSAVIMLRELGPTQIAQIGGFAWITGFAGFLLSIAVAFPLGAFFDAPALPAVIIVMSSTFLVSAPRVVPQSLLQKEMRFRVVSFIDALQSISQSLAMIVFALLGFRYWSLVIGALLGAVIAAVVTLIVRPHRVAWPRVAAVGTALGFSRDVALARIAWYAYSRADFLVAGKRLGEGPLGAYSLAWSLASVPVDKITSLVHRVTPSVFAAVKTDPAALRRYFLVITETLALATFPLAFGLAIVAEPFVLTVLTDKWAASILPLRILAVYASLGSVTALFAPMLAAIGEQRFAMWNNVATAVVLPIGFVLASRWGIGGIAAAWIVLHPPFILAQYRRLARHVKLPVGEVFKALLPALSGSLSLVVAVGGVWAVLPSTLEGTILLTTLIAVGAVGYSVPLALWHRHRISRVIRAFRLLKQGVPPTGQQA
jgi:PST family polysaccharide transporter